VHCGERPTTEGESAGGHIAYLGGSFCVAQGEAPSTKQVLIFHN
jgi:hypothetical protein